MGARWLCSCSLHVIVEIIISSRSVSCSGQHALSSAALSVRSLSGGGERAKGPLRLAVSKGQSYQKPVCILDGLVMQCT